jgi:hypothetical protein
MKVNACVAALGTALALAAVDCAATSPPPAWTNLRVLECDGSEVVTYLAPPGFGTPFNVVGSTDVIIPMFVQVMVDGQTFTTKSVPGFDPGRDDVVSCSYVDPMGLVVAFVGIRK